MPLHHSGFSILTSNFELLPERRSIRSNSSLKIENTRVVDSSFDGIVAAASEVEVHNSVSKGAGTGAGFYAYSIGGVTEMVVDSCVSTKNAYGLRSAASGIGN